MISRRQIIESQQDLVASSARLSSFSTNNGSSKRQMNDNDAMQKGRPSGSTKPSGKLAGGGQQHQDHYRAAGVANAHASSKLVAQGLASSARNQTSQVSSSRFDKLKNSYDLQREETRALERVMTKNYRHHLVQDASGYDLRSQAVGRPSRASGKQQSYQVNPDRDELDGRQYDDNQYQERFRDSGDSPAKLEREIMQQAFDPDYRQFDPYSVYGEEDEEEDVWYSEERLFEVSVV